MQFRMYVWTYLFSVLLLSVILLIVQQTGHNNSGKQVIDILTTCYSEC